MAGAMSFKDHVEVMDELRAKYQRSDDDKKALAAEQLQDDIAKAAQAREQEVRDAIRGLSLDVAAAQAAATPPEPEGAHADRSRGLLAATSEVEGELAELLEQDRCAPGLHALLSAPPGPQGAALVCADVCVRLRSTRLQQRRQRLETQKAGCQQRSERVEDLVTDAEPRTRYELSLYAHISNITWQLERGTSCVRGTVSDLVSKDIKSIDLDPAAMSEFELVNAVWDALS